jgi:putative DNA primase/helicase
MMAGLQKRNSAPAGTGNGAFLKWQADYTDPIRAFQDAMRAAGINPPAELNGDGRLHRFHVEGHRRGTRNGAYVFHLDGKPAGWFQDFRSGVSGTWKAGGGRWHMDDATRRQIKEDRQKRQAETEARHLKRAAEARVLWGRAKPCTEHAYLARKAVPSHGLRVYDWPKWIEGPDGWRRVIISGALLVPMVDEAGDLWNLQAIFPEIRPELGRDKDFMGGRKAGLFFTIGAPSDTLRIAEGYATGATVRAITGDRVFVAFDAGNLTAVARAVRKLHPQARIIIMADNDRRTPGNPGLTKAREAALAVGGLVSVPQFPEGSTGTDWNDWHQGRRNHGSA